MQATVVNVSCNHCGAPLSVPSDTRFVTCTYCRTQLQVHLNGAAAYTEIIQVIDQRTEQIARDVQEIKLREQLEQLDREWMLAQEGFKVSGRNGGRAPASTGAAIGSLIVAVFAIVWAGTAVKMGAPAIFPIFGGVMVLACIVTVITTLFKAADYQQASDTYQRQRQRLIDSINLKR